MINEEEFTRGSAFRRLEGAELNGEGQGGFTSEMMQVISAQNILIMKLLHKQNMLYRQLAATTQSSDSGSGNDKSQHPPSNDPLAQQNSSNSPSCLPLPKQLRQNALVVYPRVEPTIRRERENFVDEVEEAEGDGEWMSDFRSERSHHRQPQTKNMIKNFAKAIIAFIVKHIDIRSKVLATIGLEEANFMAVLNRIRGKVHSIAELRSLWTREDDFGRAFRIFSGEYLRRHSLERTFNSRVQNYSVHLKYRVRLLEGLKRPQEFTALKIN